MIEGGFRRELSVVAFGAETVKINLKFGVGVLDVRQRFNILERDAQFFFNLIKCCKKLFCVALHRFHWKVVATPYAEKNVSDMLRVI